MKTVSCIAFTLLFTILLSCTKKDNPPKVDPDPLPPVSFTIPQTRDIVMYEINLRAYSNSGDIHGVTMGLDKIKALGVNVIWLMPIYPIGELHSVNSPYSVKNYTEVNPEFGSLSDLQTLVSEAHSKGMAVILDWVANHTAWDNSWIDNPDWYTRDANGNIVIPPGTNWQDVADLNYDNQEMRLKMIEAMKFWIDTADIDGFRCDAADMVPYDFWQQANEALIGFTTKDLIMLAEGNRNDHFSAGFDLNFSWDFYNQIKKVFNGTSTVSSLFSTNNSEYNNIPARKHKLRFTTNHDESAWDATPMVLFNGKSGALAASAITIFLGGVPLIYDGQEVGVVENIPFFSNSPINWSLNPDMKDDYAKMLHFYASSKVVKEGVLSTYNHASVAAFSFKLETEVVVILVNTKNAVVSYTIPSDLVNTNWTEALSDASITLAGELDLTPYEFLLLKSN
ncbi:MAG: alpha-amylase [Bacteroidetes bacterium GWF2_41_31]|nr:MAG: alpha-amylase [Bacteroidetes bacterium GWF2_41_31]OFZ08734.1 MAG: alpha-amylase [Bacteroidetes bacterium RIFOXYB12_FULL_41_6]